MGQASAVPEDQTFSTAQPSEQTGYHQSASSLGRLENDAKRHHPPVFRSAHSDTDMLIQRSFQNGTLPVLNRQTANDYTIPPSSSLPPDLSKSALCKSEDDLGVSMSSVSSAGHLQRGRRVIRRRRFDEGDNCMPQRRVSFRARMRYDLVLDRTATMRRSKKPGRLTLITTSYFNQPSMGVDETDGIEKALAPHEIRLEDVSERVELHNKSIGREVMWVTADGTALEGYVNVRLQLTQPIHVMRVGSFGNHEALMLPNSHSSGSASLHVVRLKNCTRTALVSSDTTAGELIDLLIRNYQVIEDPHTFALFQCSTVKGSHRGRQLDDEERPLLLMLIWGARSPHYLQLKEARRPRQPSVKESVLHEEMEQCLQLAPAPKNGIDWEAFSLPELENFLEMLAQEEQRQLKELEDRFAKRRHQLLELCCSKAEEEAKLLSQGVTVNGSITTLV